MRLKSNNMKHQIIISIVLVALLGCTNTKSQKTNKITETQQKQPELKNDWEKRLQYVGVVIKDDNFHIWGSSPI